MSLAAKRQKDQEMAARMKALRIERTEMRCPMCHGIISQRNLQAHLGTCGGQQRERK